MERLQQQFLRGEIGTQVISATTLQLDLFYFAMLTHGSIGVWCIKGTDKSGFCGNRGDLQSNKRYEKYSFAQDEPQKENKTQVTTQRMPSLSGGKKHITSNHDVGLQ